MYHFAIDENNNFSKYGFYLCHGDHLPDHEPLQMNRMDKDRAWEVNLYNATLWLPFVGTAMTIIYFMHTLCKRGGFCSDPALETGKQKAAFTAKLVISAIPFIGMIMLLFDLGVTLDRYCSYQRSS